MRTADEALIAGHALKRLAELAAEHADAREAMDAALTAQVTECRRAGWSWLSIGEAIGYLTPEAVRDRFRRRGVS